MTYLKGIVCVSALAATAVAQAELANGVYQIASKHSGKYMEVASANTSNGANVGQWSETGHDTQKWIVTQRDDGYYSIINLHSGRAMEVYEFSTSNGANVDQWEYWGGVGQHWDISDQGNGYYAIINKNSGLAVDLLNWETSNGANIGQWGWWGGDAQLWSFDLIQRNGGEPIDTSTTGGAPNHWPVSGSLVTHDPTLYYENGTWWVFQTGDGIYGKVSYDGLAWEGLSNVFPNGLSWWSTYVPGHNGMDVWAPEVEAYNGKVYLYYAISTFGYNTSAIGMATASSVAAGDWVDQGLVINTTTNDDWNAIDPDLVVDEDGDPWLVMGSWFSGIKLSRLNPVTMKPIGPLYSLAAREGGIEAPTLIYRQGYYYLFVSVGKCCRGVDSTYRMMVGRSQSITGPYLDKNGNDMLNGGGTLFDGGNDIWAGPGGQDIVNTDVIVRHAYDATDSGTPKLLISTLNWTSDGWPTY